MNLIYCKHYRKKDHYYESQIDIQESDEEMEKVDAERFNAGLTAFLIRKGMEVTVLVAFIPFLT